ncbi:ATP-binding cassette domain-containing protein [Granulicatella seriolae]|uniref:ABC transporter ATP-binding protein/permease n=1 Tax=Granulicatella seriolae TaxID=2967226 RepID=A0ABT1WPX3_9LACT|nr:ABC transporter ATP-binding protein [Granulicatella seriolae]
MKNEIWKKFKKNLMFYSLIGIVVALLKSINTFYFQKLLDSYNLTFDPLIICLYGITLILIPILSYLEQNPRTRLYYGIYFFLKQCSLEKISRISYINYTQLNSGKLLQKIEVGASAGRNVYLNFYARLIRELLPETIFTLFFIALIDSKLLIPIAIGYVIVFFLTKFLLNVLQSLKESSLISEERMNHTLIRGITEMVTFRINKLYQREIADYEQMSDTTTSGLTRMTMIHELFFAVFALLVAIIKVVTVGFFFLGYINVSLGSLVALLIYVDRIYNPIAIFNVIFVQYNLDLISFKRLKEFFDMADDPQLELGKKVNRISNVTLSELSLDVGNKVILSDFNYSFESDTIYGLVGTSGSGKSTLVKTILGLLKPSMGKIYLDGVDFSTIKLNDFYNQVFYLSQESPIFPGTLRENIIFDKQVSDESVIDALKRSQLLKFYEELPYGLDTKINNATVSGGEKQRIAFARMFFTDATIIILDEATSALDEGTENLILKEITTLLSNKVTIMITHRPSNLVYVDEVIDLNKAEMFN